jgi:hypothetical protein
MSASESEIAAARFSWEEGLRRLDDDPSPARAQRNELAFAVADELQRRLGVTFRVADLAAEYRAASSWYFDLTARLAPGAPEAWDPAVALDAGFARMARLATDAPGRGRS